MNLDDLMKKVIDTGALTNQINTQTLCDLIDENVDRNQVQVWLNDLIQSKKEKEIAHLASLMEIHPLGFQKYVIWDEGARARLHFWNQKEELTENIHDHRFHFCAKVICGSYTHEIYEEPIISGEKVEINLVSRKEISAGDTYFFPAGTFHRILPSAKKTASFLVRGEAVLPYTRIIDPKTMKIRKGFGSVNKFVNNIQELVDQM